MNSEERKQGENNFDFFPARMLCLEKKYSKIFESSNAASLSENTFLEKIEYG